MTRLFAAIFAVLAFCAQAADAPEAVYQKVHNAVLAGNVAEMMKHATAAQRAELEKTPGKEQILKLMAAVMPKTYTVSGTQLAGDGKTAVMHASGMASLIGPPQPVYGVVNFAMEGGEWKVAKTEWNNTKPPTLAASAAPAPAPAAKPAAAPVALPSSPAPVADDGKSAARQAAEEKRAREREEAARKRAEFEKLCVIKPVMTEPEIELCRKVARSR